MIHVFSCAKEICSLPGKACVEVGKCCGQINCQPIMDCCLEFGKCFTSFMDRPLSTYVFAKVILGIAQLGACYMALQAPGLPLCKLDAPVEMSMWLNVQMGFAICHLLAAPYFQIKVWNKSEKELPELGPPPVTVPAATVHAAFKEVFLYDLGILTYAIVVTISYAWSTKGADWISAAGTTCSLDGYPGYAYQFGQCFFWLALLYNGSYFFCSCCAGSVTISGPPLVTGVPVE